jgi:serine/threonine protein kinase
MLSGGKLIGDGQYGCVFTPPFVCKHKKKQQSIEEQEDLQISKLILTPYAKKENDISILIRKIPLWKNYFVVSETMCEPAASQTDKDLSKCQLIDKEKLSQFRLLFMTYGGNPLTIHRFSLSTFDFLSFSKHLIAAGSLLQLFGIVHRDIHNGNVLVDSDDVPRIIDFNLAIFIEQESTIQLQHQYNYLLSQEPPDSTLVNAIQLGYSPEQVLSSIIYKKPIIKKISQLLKISVDDMFQELEDFYHASKSVKQGKDTKWFQLYWRTIDSWAIGVILIEQLYQLSLFKGFSWNQIQSTLQPVLIGLCHVSPLERIDCVQALFALDPNHFIIRKYASAWLEKVGKPVLPS